MYLYEQLCIYLWDVMSVDVFKQDSRIPYLPPFVLTLTLLAVKKSTTKKKK